MPSVATAGQLPEIRRIHGKSITNICDSSADGTHRDRVLGDHGWEFSDRHHPWEGERCSKAGHLICEGEKKEENGGKENQDCQKNRDSRSQNDAAQAQTHFPEAPGGRVWTNSYMESQTAGDVTAGEDPLVREAAIEALGGMNGSILAIDPETGRILAMVNQKLALSGGAIPCSTIKVPVALAALSEGIVNRDTEVALNRRVSLTLSQALAVSNNNYFEILGRRLGFDKVAYYERQFGLGELAGFEIDGEHPGTYPDEVLDAKRGGVGRMCSFGEGIEVTPLQLGALLSAVANGGTLYYLQHPRSAEEIATFTPRVKRYLEIGSVIPDLQEGLRGAVEHGTARTVAYNFHEEAILGKTGTCSENHTRHGWFASFANTSAGKIAVVVMLQGGYEVSGPKAAELAGKVYRRLYDGNYFGPSNTIQAERRQSVEHSGEPTVRGVSQ